MKLRTENINPSKRRPNTHVLRQVESTIGYCKKKSNVNHKYLVTIVGQA